jgi:hypothetical protein
MDKVVVHPRVHERHPELSEDDVLDAWTSCIQARPRLDRGSIEYLAVGSDAKGRLIEMVARRTRDGLWVIYHAFTPPTKKALRELGMTRR